MPLFLRLLRRLPRNSMGSLKGWFKDWEVSHLASKGVGIFSSYMASKLAVLTTTPGYTHFWSSWSLTAPTITNQDAFTAKLATTLGICWLAVDHFMWKFIENQKVTGSPTINVEKSAPPTSPANPIPLGTRKEDPIPTEGTK